jgi:Cytochrome c oxidase subunit IV
MAGTPGDGQVPPAGEPIHLPDPTYLPVIVALGVTIALVGVVMSWYVFGLGAAITLVAVVRWVRETRRDVSELPLSHDH